MIFKGYLFGVVYALLCLGLSFVLYKLGTPKKITRKIVHILVGFEWVILHHFFGGGIHFLAVCLLFLVILAISYRKNLMPMISSDEDNAPGTVYYALAMSVMALITLFVPNMILPFGIGVFCTSLGDGLAGIIGMSSSITRNTRIYGNKTLLGALCNFVISFCVAFTFGLIFNLQLDLWHCIAIAGFSTELELFVGRGLDNISVTLGTAFLSYFLINFPTAENYLVPILLTPFIIAFAYKKRALTVSGIVAAVAVDILISISLGNFGFVILLAFFVGGITVDKIKKRSKKTAQNIEKRGDCRDHVQVLANSIVSAVCAIMYLVTSEKIFVIAFVASLAEAFADTAASGIGVLSGKAYDVFRLRRCEPGVSGGMSVLGTLASALAAAFICVIALAFGEVTIMDSLFIFAAAVIGAIFDSLLCSLVQVKYKCEICGSIVEREEHCGASTTRHSGLPFITNDSVNLLGTMFAAALAGILYIIL